ncbi:MAG: hypothetical protein WEB56_00835 [Roseovarius sp.]
MIGENWTVNQSEKYARLERIETKRLKRLENESGGHVNIATGLTLGRDIYVLGCGRQHEFHD